MTGFNMAALDSFSKAICDNDNIVVSVDRNNKDNIKQNGTYKSPGFFKWRRTSAVRTANNAVRTQLLKSLGDAFGLKGMTARTDGKIQFSREFINDLQNRLGADLKLADFGIGRDGLVSSGKPLTVRRIKAIIDKVVISQDIFDVNVYKRKMGKVMDEMKKFDGSSDLSGLKHAAKCLSFLEKLGENPLIREDPNYDYLKEFGTEEEQEKLVRFQYYDVEQQKYVPMKRIDDLQHNLGKKEVLGLASHPENQPFRPQKYVDGSENGPEKAEKYVKDLVSSYAKVMVDLHDHCKKTGKQREFMTLINNPGICLEDHLKKATEFSQEVHVSELSDAEVDQIQDLNRIADTGANEPLHKCIFAELNALFSDPKAEQGDDWEAYAARVKKNLCGQKRPITEAFTNEKGRIDFRPVMENGKPVVREITAADLDKIGPKIYDSILEG